MSDSTPELPDDLRHELADIERDMRDESRAEAREEEALVAEEELRGRSFADALLELVNRGDTVQLLTPSRSFRGQLVYVGRDFVTLRDTESTVDVSLAQPCTVHVVEKAPSGGRAKGEGPGSFEMRLYEHKIDFAEVEVHSASLEEFVKGRITTVGQDHVVVTDAQKETWLFPLQSITFVIRREQSRAR